MQSITRPGLWSFGWLALVAALSLPAHAAEPATPSGSPSAAAIETRSLGSVDQGIYPDLANKARIQPPPWEVAPGPRWLRVDPKHRLLTVYQGEVALVVYPLRSLPSLPGAGAPPALPAILGALAADDAAAVRTLLGPADPAAPTRVTVGSPPTYEDQDGDGIVNPLDVLLGAKKLCLNQAKYVSNYRALRYPGGDVPRTEGVCTDTLVRALRNAGWDLQREVHEDALRKPRLYPLEGKAPDANIDHRRIRMQLPWFQQALVRLPEGGPYLPGDILLFDTFPSKAGADHAGIVSDRLGPSGKPLIVNNWTDGCVEEEMDLLHFVPVLYHFRVPTLPRGGAPAASPAQTATKMPLRGG